MVEHVVYFACGVVAWGGGVQYECVVVGAFEHECGAQFCGFGVDDDVILVEVHVF